MECLFTGSGIGAKVILEIAQEGNQSFVKVSRVEIKENAPVNDGAGYLVGTVKLNDRPAASLIHEGNQSCGVNLSGYSWSGGGTNWSGFTFSAVPVTHASDGTGSVTVAVNVSAYTTRGIYIGTVNAVQTVILPTTLVPEATVPIFENAPVTLGSILKITLSPNLDTLRHTLLYQADGVQTQIAADLPAGETAWEVPYSLAAVFPTQTEGMAQLVCRTYLDGKPVGEEQAVWFQFVVPDNDITKPVIDSFLLTPEGDLPEKFAGLHIRNVTRLRGELTAHGPYSPIRAYQLTGSGITSEASRNSPCYGYSEASGPVTVFARVTDWRGFCRELGAEIFVHPYNPPSAAPAAGSAVVCIRCDAQGVPDSRGTHLKIEARKQYSSIAPAGVELNTCRMEYRFRQAAAAQYSAWTPLPDAETYVSKEMLLDVKHSYQVQLRASDDIGREGILTLAIPSDHVTLHLKRGGKGAAFFKRAERDGVLEVAGDLMLSGTLTLGSTQLTEEQLNALLALLTP